MPLEADGIWTYSHTVKGHKVSKWRRWAYSHIHNYVLFGEFYSLIFLWHEIDVKYIVCAQEIRQKRTDLISSVVLWLCGVS
jgi:hypothetical protein